MSILIQGKVVVRELFQDIVSFINLPGSLTKDGGPVTLQMDVVQNEPQGHKYNVAIPYKVCNS